MAAKPKTETKEQDSQAESPLVLTVSEVAKLSDEEKAKFRHSGGTVIEDPQ